MCTRYKNSKIYKLVDNNNFYYYGSTTNSIEKRYLQHKQASECECKRKIYKIFTKDKFDEGKIRIELVSELNLENFRQLLIE